MVKNYGLRDECRRLATGVTIPQTLCWFYYCGRVSRCGLRVTLLICWWILSQDFISFRPELFNQSSLEPWRLKTGNWDSKLATGFELPPRPKHYALSSPPIPCPGSLKKYSSILNAYWRFSKISTKCFQNLSTVSMSIRSSGEWAPRIVGPIETISSSGYFSRNNPHSRPAWIERTIGSFPNSFL